MELRGLTKKFGDNVIFDNCDLVFEENKITAVMGRSGRGKTTLLNIIAGLDTDYSGEIIGSSPCAYIFQEPRLLKGATVLENTLIGSGFKNREKAIKLLEEMELSDYINEYPKALSGGMAMRVSMARAFVSGRSVILMDEAFKSLDKDLKYRLYDMFLRLWNSSGKPTTIIVTHDKEEAEYKQQDAFGTYFYKFWACPTVMFDLAAVWPGEWHHVVAVASWELNYSALAGADDDDELFQWETTPGKKAGAGISQNYIREKLTTADKIIESIYVVVK